MSAVMRSHFVRDVCMESTGIYWIPIWCLLEKEFTPHLVNPQFLKQLPGRKSDVKDAQWIATVLIKGLVRDSFVPDDNVQRLRQYGRTINRHGKSLPYAALWKAASVKATGINPALFMKKTFHYLCPSFPLWDEWFYYFLIG